jgi:hypothetical protein
MRSVIATPEFIDHEAWDKFAWLVPHETGDEPWYYRVPTDEGEDLRKLPTDPNFTKTLDPAVRPLVGWLHQKGIPTGPSCSGHDLDKRDFGQIFSNLREDGKKIRGSGLLLRDPEDGKDYVMQDDSYTLPWGSLDAFRKVASHHQPVGWLPFYTTDPRAELAVGHGTGFEIKQTAPDIFGVRTDGTNPDAWKEASAVLRRALG